MPRGLRGRDRIPRRHRMRAPPRDGSAKGAASRGRGALREEAGGRSEQDAHRMTENAGSEAGGARCADASRAVRLQSLFPLLISVLRVHGSSPVGVPSECSSRAGQPPISRIGAMVMPLGTATCASRRLHPQVFFLHEV